MAETETPFTIARRWNDFLECPQGTARSTAFARAKSFNASPNKYRNKSNNTRNIDRESVAIWKFLAADVESVEHSRPICRWRAEREADSSEAIVPTPLSAISFL